MFWNSFNNKLLQVCFKCEHDSSIFSISYIAGKETVLLLWSGNILSCLTVNPAVPTGNQRARVAL